MPPNRDQCNPALECVANDNDAMVGDNEYFLLYSNRLSETLLSCTVHKVHPSIIFISLKFILQHTMNNTLFFQWLLDHLKKVAAVKESTHTCKQRTPYLSQDAKLTSN